MPSAQGKVLDPASKVGEVRDPGDQLQVVDALTDRHLELMGIHQPGEGAPHSLPLCGLCQKVRVPGEEDAPERSGPVQKLRVREPAGTILVSGQDVDGTEPEPLGDGPGHVHIYVEADAQESRPRALSRAARGESPASFWN